MQVIFPAISDVLEENCTKVAGQMNDLRNHYIKKACLNCNQNEKMIDIFRGDDLLSKML